MKVAAAVLLLALLGCVGTPTEESRICGACAVPGTAPPSPETVTATLETARQDAALTCRGVSITTPLPSVTWWQCRTWIADAITSPGGRTHGACAAGATRPDGREIFVSLDDPANVTRLVWWEGRNAAWIRGGCAGQAL